jgi:lipoate-protein ligase A
VLRAIQSLGLSAANVNERNDICVEKFKISTPSLSSGGDEDADDGFGRHVSGSAYKIVNKRAYHHGTMLISSELGTLGKLLHSNKVPNSSSIRRDWG